jgi:type IV pilus assembly protein PilM
MALFGRKKTTVGLDIGSSAVKAVVLRRGRGGWSLVAAGETPLPEGSLQEGSAAEPTAVSEAVSQLFDSLRIRRGRVAAALAGHAVIVKRLSLPAMSEAELADAIPWEAEQYIPFDLSEVQLDYQVVNTGDPAKTSLDVLLVAAKRDRIDDRAGIITQTGHRPAVLDIEAFALANAYQMNYPERTDPLAALVHVGRGMTIVCLLEKGEPVFTRDISIGGQIHLDAILRDKFKLEVGKDYEAVFSGKHDNSILGVANKDYPAAAVANSVLKRMIARGALKAEQVKTIFASESFPSASRTRPLAE